MTRDVFCICFEELTPRGAIFSTLSVVLSNKQEIKHLLHQFPRHEVASNSQCIHEVYLKDAALIIHSFLSSHVQFDRCPFFLAYVHRYHIYRVVVPILKPPAFVPPAGPR